MAGEVHLPTGIKLIREERYKAFIYTSLIGYICSRQLMTLAYIVLENRIPIGINSLAADLLQEFLQNVSLI